MIKIKRKAMGKGKKVTLSEQQTEWLKENFSILLNSEICEKLGISNTTMHRIVRECGLKKDWNEIAPKKNEKEKEGWAKFKTDRKRYSEFLNKIKNQKLRREMFEKGCNPLYGKTDEEKSEIRKRQGETFKNTVQRERARVRIGLPQATKLPSWFLKTATEQSSKRRKIKWNLKKRYGYADGGGLTILYNSNTKRTSKEYLYERRYGFKFVNTEIETTKKEIKLPPDWSDKQGGFAIE